MMIVILFPFVAFFAFFVGLLIVGGWYAAALLFGLPIPTHDQFEGVVLGTVVLSQVGLGGILCFILVVEGQ